MLIITALIIALISYLTGSLSAAIITCKIMRLPDPRMTGSNNPGTTNVMRIGGKKAAAITLIGDILKGLIPVLITGFFFTAPLLVAVSALAAFLGHLFPIFFGFKGGKGVATALGCILALSPLVALCALATWIIIFVTTRISSLSALVAATLSPLYLWLFNAPSSVVISVLIVVVILIIRHKANIIRIATGTESKISFRKK